MEDNKKTVAQIIMMSILILAVVCCAAVPAIISTVKTVLDVAELLCEVTAQERIEELDGLSPKKWCSVGANRAQFVEATVGAQRAAGIKTGLIEAPDEQ